MRAGVVIVPRKMRAHRRECVRKTIEQKKVTYDFHRLMDGATKVKCSEFGNYIIENMNASNSAAAD